LRFELVMLDRRAVQKWTAIFSGFFLLWVAENDGWRKQQVGTVEVTDAVAIRADARRAAESEPRRHCPYHDDDDDDDDDAGAPQRLPLDWHADSARRRRPPGLGGACRNGQPAVRTSHSRLWSRRDLDPTDALICNWLPREPAFVDSTCGCPQLWWTTEVDMRERERLALGRQ